MRHNMESGCLKEVGIYVYAVEGKFWDIVRIFEKCFVVFCNKFSVNNNRNWSMRRLAKWHVCKVGIEIPRIF